MCRCTPCTVAMLKDNAAPEGLCEDFDRQVTPLVAGLQSLRQHGGTYLYRHSSVRMLLKYSALFGLETLPGDSIVLEAYMAHRILVQGVNAATVEHDIITASTWCSDFRQKTKIELHDPAKHISVKQFIRRLTTKVRVQASCTVPFAMRNFVMMIRVLGDSCRDWHSKVCLQVLAWPALRKGAAKKIYMRRDPPVPLTLRFVKKGPGASDVFIYPHRRYGKVVALRKNVDKALQPGREQWGWMCDGLMCGLTPASDLEHYITTWPVPDGPLLAAPSGPSGTGFNQCEYTNLDGCVASTWGRTFPEQTDEKVAPHSLRKMLIQALYDHLKFTGKFSEADIGEYVGWISVKNATRPYYAGLGEEEYLEMLSSLDPAVLPWHVATVSTGPAILKEH